LHSRDYVCDEIGDLLVALTKCPNAPILIVDEIPGAIHVLIHAAISVPEVVPVHLDPLQARADRPDLVRAAPLALEMMIVAVILVVVTVTERHVAILVIDRVLIVARVVNLAIVPVAIVVRAVTVLAAIVIGLLAVTDLTHVAIPVVAIVQPEIVVQGPIVVHVVNMVIVPFVVMIHVVILVVAIVIVHRVATLVTARLVTVHHAASSVTDRLVIVHRAVISAIDRVLIVVRVVNMVIVPFVVMIHVVILVVAIVIVHHAASSVIDRLVVMTQALTHVVAIVIAPLVAMALVLDVRRAHVVMTVGTVVAAVGRVVKTSLHADQRTKPNVVVKPCAHVAVAKYAKTASKLRCHVKPRPGLTKAELKMKSAMPPKVPCAVRSHRDALCRRDQKMKTN
jgi:hypothetical protein